MRSAKHSLCAACLLAACASTSPPPPPSAPPPRPPAEQAVHVQFGEATWYGKWHQGGPTASGERFNMWSYTAAHRSLPMGVRVRVTNLRNGKQVIVRINDRGPFGFRRRRIIDLSYAAARALDMLESGVVPVRVEVLAP